MKKRVDELLVEQGYVIDKEEAKKVIIAGLVFIDNFKVDTAGEKVDVNSNFICKFKDNKYVSRGGLKLEKALKTFDIDVKGKEAIDIGSSTGGFTDCLLQKGICKVYAIDVGTNQLDYKIRKDDRVVVLEQTNLKDIKTDMFSNDTTLAVCDVSFISIEHVFKKVNELDNIDTLIALIKPQFEVNSSIASEFKGVIDDANIHIDVISNLINYAKKLNLNIVGLNYSPILGGKNGNIEYISVYSKTKKDKQIDIEMIVNDAFKELK